MAFCAVLLCAQGLEREGVGVLRRGASKDASLSTIVVATIVSTFLLRRRTRTTFCLAAIVSLSQVVKSL
eukprot:COSAG02_NODE_1924_length_10351_cov_4.487320_8_plen_69_part_00